MPNPGRDSGRYCSLSRVASPRLTRLDCVCHTLSELRTSSYRPCTDQLACQPKFACRPSALPCFKSPPYIRLVIAIELVPRVWRCFQVWSGKPVRTLPTTDSGNEFSLTSQSPHTWIGIVIVASDFSLVAFLHRFPFGVSHGVLSCRLDLNIHPRWALYCVSHGELQTLKVKPALRKNALMRYLSKLWKQDPHSFTGYDEPAGVLNPSTRWHVLLCLRSPSSPKRVGLRWT